MTPAPSTTPNATRIPAWLPYAVGPILIAILVALLAGVAIWTEQQRYRERAVVATQNMARLLDAHVADRFDKVDAMLRLAAHEYVTEHANGRAGEQRINQFLTTHQMPLPEILSLRVVDAQGVVRFGSDVAPGSSTRVADRGYFVRAAAGPRSGLVIDGPLASRVSGQWVLVLARGLYSPDGRFLGVLVANLATDPFGQRLSEIELGSHGTVGLRTAGLGLVHQYPAGEGPGGALAAGSVPDALRAAIAQDPTAGYYVATSDGIERSNVYRKVRGYPFYLIVGLATDDYLDGWRANSFLFSALAGLTIALTLIVCIALYRTSRRQIESINDRFSAIIQASSDAIVGCSTTGTVTSWNRGAVEMFGYGAEEMLGQPLGTLAPAHSDDEESALLARIARRESVQPFEALRRHKEGQGISVSIAMTPVHDSRGSVSGVSVVLRDTSRQKALERHSGITPLHDALTRLPNRQLLADRLQQAQLTSRRQRSYFAVLFIDLDEFRQVNARLGYAAGDQLLVEVARRLQLAVRQADTVARLGADEFVVILQDLGGAEAYAADHVNSVADKILNLLEQDYRLGARRHQGSASVGIKLLIGGALSVDQILKEADAAMYRVRHQRQSLLQGAFQ